MKAKDALKPIGSAASLLWQDWPNQVLVSLVAILAGLTLVLYPAAIFGVYADALDLTHGIRTGIIGFWQGFKSYFKQNLVWGLANTLVLAGVGFNVWFYTNSDYAIAPVLLVLIILLGVFWLIWQFFTLACFFLQEEKSLKLAWKNGLAILLGNPLYAFIIGLVALILVFLSVRYYIPLFIGSLPLIALLHLLAVQKTLPEAEGD